MEKYEKILETLHQRISFGYGGIHIYRPAELSAEQIGYSVSPDGESLTGETSGDWLKSWVVIGREESFGDPIFIDTTEEAFPVYTAMHGEGAWKPERIAVSLEAFGRTLSALAVIAEGRENPVALETNPLTSSEKEDTFAFIRNTNPGVKLDFWDALLS